MWITERFYLGGGQALVEKAGRNLRAGGGGRWGGLVGASRPCLVLTI